MSMSSGVRVLQRKKIARLALTVSGVYINLNSYISGNMSCVGLIGLVLFER